MVRLRIQFNESMLEILSLNDLDISNFLARSSARLSTSVLMLLNNTCTLSTLNVVVMLSISETNTCFMLVTESVNIKDSLVPLNNCDSVASDSDMDIELSLDLNNDSNLDTVKSVVKASDIDLL